MHARSVCRNRRLPLLCRVHLVCPTIRMKIPKVRRGSARRSTRVPLLVLIQKKVQQLIYALSYMMCSSAHGCIVQVASTTTESSVTPASVNSTVPLIYTASASQQTRATGPSWHCRSCGKDPCESPTATQCGHIFCHRCVCASSLAYSTYSYRFIVASSRRLLRGWRARFAGSYSLCG